MEFGNWRERGEIEEKESGEWRDKMKCGHKVENGEIK